MNDQPGALAGDQIEVRDGAYFREGVEITEEEAIEAGYSPNGGASLDELEPADATPDSVFDGLREEYAKSTIDRTKTILIAPGRYKGNLAVRLRPTEKIWKQYRKMAERVEQRGGGEAAMLDFAASTIVQITETILYRKDDSGDLKPMASFVPSWAGEPVKWDERLCEAIGVELVGGEKATQICRLIFKSEGALDDAFVTVDAWLKEAIPSDVPEGTDAEDEGDEAGERPM